MQSYTLTDTRDRNSEVFEKAAIEPVETDAAIAIQPAYHLDGYLIS